MKAEKSHDKGVGVECPYCKVDTHFVDSSYLYRRSYGMIYLCFKCGASVGVHKGTDKPLGTPASKELKKLRMDTHKVFDRLWKGGPYNRSQAYRKLARALDIDNKDCHIGMFDEETCRQVIQLVRSKKL